MIKAIIGMGNFLERIEAYTSIVFMAAAICMCLYSIFYRTFGGAVGSWVETLIQYLVIWAAFLSVGWALRKDRHIGVTVLLKRMPDNARKIGTIVIHSIGLIACVTVVIYGFQNIVKLKSLNTAVYEFFDLPVYPFVLSVPFGMTLLSFHFVEKLGVLLSSLSPRKNEAEEMEHK